MHKLYIIIVRYISKSFCRRFDLPLFRPVAVLVCRRFDLSPFWPCQFCRRFGVAVLTCRRFGLSPFWPYPFCTNCTNTQCLLSALKGEGRFASWVILIGCAKTDEPITWNITGSFCIFLLANTAWPSYRRIARSISNKAMYWHWEITTGRSISILWRYTKPQNIGTYSG